MPRTRLIGKQFEDQAARYLISQGFTMITRRFTCRGGEIDLVAMDGDQLVFVEVKASRQPGIRAGESLTPEKWERMQVAASQFFKKMEMAPQEFRVDVITIDGGEIRHFRNAAWE